eukprot:scaffold463_cov242-Pinguiococcus_pyrenoidosus.AAC.15
MRSSSQSTRRAFSTSLGCPLHSRATAQACVEHSSSTRLVRRAMPGGCCGGLLVASDQKLGSPRKPQKLGTCKLAEALAPGSTSCGASLRRSPHHKSADPVGLPLRRPFRPPSALSVGAATPRQLRGGLCGQGGGKSLPGQGGGGAGEGLGRL